VGDAIVPLQDNNAYLFDVGTFSDAKLDLGILFFGLTGSV